MTQYTPTPEQRSKMDEMVNVYPGNVQDIRYRVNLDTEDGNVLFLGAPAVNDSNLFIYTTVTPDGGWTPMIPREGIEEMLFVSPHLQWDNADDVEIV